MAFTRTQFDNRSAVIKGDFLRKVLILVALLTAPAFAQEAVAPSLDTADKQLIAVVATLAKNAQAACSATSEWKAYNDLTKAVDANLLAKHGTTLDWNTGKLKAK